MMETTFDQLNVFRAAIGNLGAGSRSAPYVSTGCRPLDEVLPVAPAGELGLPRGSLVEWLGAGSGNATTLMAVIGAREAAREGGALVFVDRGRTFYPPAALAWGIDLQRTWVVHPENERDELWAIDQVLRCPHVAALVSWPQKLDSITFRRWQLAAERSGCMGLLVRPARVSRDPSWADLRIQVMPCGNVLDPRSHWRVDLKILRCRGKVRKEVLKLQIDDRTGEIHEAHVSHLAAQLAHPKASLPARRARA